MKLRKVLAFTRGARCILAYNARFEQQCIRGLGEHLPHLAEPLEKVAGRMVDLLPLVRDHVYHPRFRGSFGLKNVVPALVPGLDYEELEIGEGGEARARYWDDEGHVIDYEARVDCVAPGAPSQT